MTNMTNVYTNHSKIFRKDNFCDEIPEVLLYIVIIVIVCVFTMDIMFVYQKHTLDLQQQKNDIEQGLKSTKEYENMKKEMIEQQIANQTIFTKMVSRMDYMKGEISYLNQEIRNNKDK